MRLFDEFVLGGLRLRNRVVMAPMTRCRSEAGLVPSAMSPEYYARRAGAGLIVTEATVISEGAVGIAGTPGIFTDAQEAGWRRVTEAVHARGGVIYCQLWHCGRSSHSSLRGGELPVSASAVRIETDMVHTPMGKVPFETPRPLRAEEIPGIVSDYRRAAERAKSAGFDGVEIHGANGYLLDQFLQSKTNRRTDAYGGSVENRFRFLRQVVEAVAGSWNANRVAVRLSPNGIYNDMGSPDYRETFSYAARELDGYGLAYLHVMDGLAFGAHQHGPPMTLSEFRPMFRGPLMGNCGYTGESAESAIAGGWADLIAFGRPFLSNPDLVERLRTGSALRPPLDMSLWYGGGATGYLEMPEAG